MTSEDKIHALKLIKLKIEPPTDNRLGWLETWIHKEDLEAFDSAIKALEQEPKIKVLDRDEVARKLGTVDIYKANAWITLLKDLEYLGMKICEVEE